MFNNIAQIIITATIAVCMLSTVSAQNTTAPMNKHIYIGSPTQQPPLQVDFSPLKSSFAVNESIKFKIEGNKKFFLFLFNIDYANDEAVMILPNKLQGAKRNMYLARQRLTVPNPNAEFYSDRPGSERIIMMATTKYPKEIVLSNYRRAGNFRVTEAQTIQQQLKRIQLREPQIRASKTEEIFITEFDLAIHGNNTSNIPVQPVAQPPKDWSIRLNSLDTNAISSIILPEDKPAIAFVSTDKVNYQSGDTLTISFGANQNGWLTLYNKNSRGEYEYMAEHAVTANAMNYVTALTGRQGAQEILCIFSKTKGYKASEHDFNLQQKNTQKEGFIITQDPSRSPLNISPSNSADTSIATASTHFWVY